MNDERLDDLIDHHLNGVIDGNELAELEERLLHSAADRERFWKLAEVHSLLHERGGSGGVEEWGSTGVGAKEIHPSTLRPAPQLPFSPTPALPFSPTPALPLSPASARRSLISAAIGLLLGLCSASVVWAMALNQWRVPKTLPLPLFDGGFEVSDLLGDEGVPTRAGVWGGDFAKVVSSERGVVPVEGRRMLQFLRGDNRLTPADAKSSVAELWQVVDLQALDLKSEVSSVKKQPAVVEVSAQFNATADTANERLAFAVSVLAFSGDVSEMPELWRGRRELALAAADKEEMADSDANQWQKLTAQVTVPPDANLLLVQVRATRKGPGPKSQEFGGAFVDAAGVKKWGNTGTRKHGNTEARERGSTGARE